MGQDRDLNYFLEQAKTNSPLINQKLNDNKIVALDVRQVRAILSKPEINVEAGVLFSPIVTHDNSSNQFEWVSNGANNYTGYDIAVTDGGQYQAMVSLNQPLFTGSSFRKMSVKANVLSQINQNDIALTIHEIEQLVGYQYILCLKSRLQTENTQELLDELSSRLLIMQKLVENAIYKQTDLMLIQIEYKNYELEMKTFQAEYQNNLYDLNLLCGINDTSLVNIQDINLQLNPEITAQSQFLNTYKLDSLSIAAEQSIFGIKYIPKLSFFANAGMNAVYVPAFNRLGFSTGLTFSWNIFDGNQRKIVNEKSAIGIETIDFQKSKFIIQRDINKNKILNQINSLNQRINLSEEQLEQYEQLLKVYQNELTQGDISVIDFRNIVRDRVTKKQQSIMLQMEKQLLINSYKYWNF
jgi:outer membrane protein TolC